MRLAQMLLMTVMITFCIGVITDQSLACLITVIDSDISEHHRSWKILFITDSIRGLVIWLYGYANNPMPMTDIR